MSERRSWPRPFFFVHVMKTAGMTLNRHIDANFAPDECYPTDHDRPMDYMVIKRLREAIEERGDRVRLWRGHFPYFVTAMVPDAVTMTILREPVARTLSMLAQYRARNEPDKTLEAVYDDPRVNDRMLRNHQTKVFSHRSESKPAQPRPTTRSSNLEEQVPFSRRALERRGSATRGRSASPATCASQFAIVSIAPAHSLLDRGARPSSSRRGGISTPRRPGPVLDRDSGIAFGPGIAKNHVDATRSRSRAVQ